MRKIVNSLLYGSSKTKSYLWSMLGLLCVALVFTILAITRASFPMAIVAFLAIGIDVAVFQSVSLEDMVKDGAEGVEKKKVKKIKHKAEKLSMGYLNTKDKKTGDELVDELGMEILSSKNKKKDISKEEKDEEDEEDDEKEKKSCLKNYDSKSIKKLMLKYKVKKEHRKVMIDSSSAFRIRQCPAYLWKDRKDINFLLIEKEPRIIKIPIERIKGIGYDKMVEAKPTSDYQNFMEPCIITKLFSEYVPLYKEGSYHGKVGVFKNLYTVIPDIRITSTSAKNLFDILEVEFAVADEVTNSRAYSEYYKVAYKANILWKDSVISTSEYKDRIKKLLTYVASEHLSKQVYDDLLQQLVDHKLITNEYAIYYRGLKK